MTSESSTSLVAFAIAFVVVLSLLGIVSLYNAPELSPASLSISELAQLAQIKYILSLIVALGAFGLAGITLAMHLRLTEILAR